MRLIWVAAAVTALFAAGCGERPTVTEFKKGQYQGKPDTQPWASLQFKGDRVAWESAIKARTNNQNEYTRAITK